jgi:hypothetical protein
MKKPFIAIYTETPNSGRDAVTAALFLVFANRDAQTPADVDGTKVSLESQGEGVHVREFDLLADIPDVWDLKAEAAARAEADKIIAERIAPSPAGAGEGGRRPDEGRRGKSVFMVITIVPGR